MTQRRIAQYGYQIGNFKITNSLIYAAARVYSYSEKLKRLTNTQLDYAAEKKMQLLEPYYFDNLLSKI